MAYSHGVFPLVYNSLKKYDTLIDANKLIYMKQLNMDLVKRNMIMTSELIKILKLLEENKIEAIPFKGPSLSQIAYGDVISRQYVDLDIVVNNSNKLKIIQILNSIEYNIDDEVDISRNLNSISVITLFNKKNNVTIEIHWKLLSINYAINIDRIDFFSEINSIYINNYEIKIFNSEFLLVYLCIHGSKHLYERFAWINDINLLISKEKINWEKVFDYAKLLEIEKLICISLNISFLIFDTAIPQNIKDDAKCKKVALDIIQLEDKDEKLTLKSFLILLRQRNGFLKKLELMVKLFFYPKETDLIFFNLPKSLELLYIEIRPVRLFIKIFTKKES